MLDVLNQYNLPMSQIIRFILSITILGSILQCSGSKAKKSLEDLRVAFNNESTNAEKYEKYGQAALNQGFDTLAQLFIAVAKSERIHATNHGKVIERFGIDSGIAEIGNFEVKSTAENLKEAVKSEMFDFQTVYQAYIRDAEREKATEIAKTFTWAWNSEKKHLQYFRLASSVISKGHETNLPFVWFICSTCGNMYTITDLKKECEFCLTKQENFIGYTKPSE